MTFELRDICPLLQVFDMPASLAFYRDVLGFAIVEAAPQPPLGGSDGFDWVWLRRDGAYLMLNTAYDPDAVRPPVPEPARVAAHGDTGLFFTCADLDAVHERLLACGVPAARPAVAPYGMRQLYVKDPDGFELCFQWPVRDA